VLTPVLVGLGLFSTFSVWCLVWLERLQPLFFTVAVAALAYQIWIVRRRPPFLRTWGVKTILGVSLAVNGLMIAAWIVITIRYW
jgi:hypothetical protein